MDQTLDGWKGVDWVLDRNSQKVAPLWIIWAASVAVSVEILQEPIAIALDIGRRLLAALWQIS